MHWHGSLTARSCSATGTDNSSVSNAIKWPLWRPPPQTSQRTGAAGMCARDKAIQRAVNAANVANPSATSGLDRAIASLDAARTAGSTKEPSWATEVRSMRDRLAGTPAG